MFCCLWPLLFLGCCGNDRCCCKRHRKDPCRREPEPIHCERIDFPTMNIYRGFDPHHCCK